MVRVKISYSVYADAMSIYIDDKPIPPISRLTRFQTMPFGHWCSEIFNAVADEVNDKFSLTYVGRPCESMVLSNYMRATATCVSYENRQPQIPDNALMRLKKLSSLCQSGAKCERFVLPLHVYTDLPEEEAAQLLNAGLPKLAYCKIGIKTHPLSEMMTHKEPSPGFILSGKPAQQLSLGMRELSAAMCVLCISEANAFVGCKDNWFIENVTRDRLEERLKIYLELVLYPFILEKALKRTEVPENSPLYLSVAILNKTEPQTIVSLPSSVEFGETVPVKIRTVPENAEPAKIVYRISDESVIVQNGDGLKAVGTGEAVVEAYVSGHASRIAVGKVTAFRRNRIKKLQVGPKSIEMAVGDQATLTYNFEPRDADNASSLKMVSSDGTVAAPERGMSFVARRPGTCRMVVQAEKVSDSCEVRVYPRLEALEIRMENTKLRVGTIESAPVFRIPSGATLDKLVFQVDPPSLGVYDLSTQSFLAKSTGRGTLTVLSAKNGAVKAVKEVEVKSAVKPFRKTKWPVALAAGAILLLLYILSRFFN